MNKFINIDGLKRIATNLNKIMNDGLSASVGLDEGVSAAKKLDKAVQIEFFADGVTSGIKIFDGSSDIVLVANEIGLVSKLELDAALDKLVDKVAGKGLVSNDFVTDFRNKVLGVEAGANNYVHPETHNATVLIQNENNRFVTDAEKAVFSDKYTKEETSDKVAISLAELIWLPTVETYDDIVTTYPNPVDGNVVNVNDTDITYRYTGAEWIAISANTIPTASAIDDGKMTSTDLVKLEGIEENANNYKHEEAHNANIIVEDSEHRFATDEEIARWNDVQSATEVSEKAQVLMNDDSEASSGNVDDVFEDMFGASKFVMVINGYHGELYLDRVISYTKFKIDGVEITDGVIPAGDGTANTKVLEFYDAVHLNNGDKIWGISTTAIVEMSGEIDMTQISLMGRWISADNMKVLDMSKFKLSKMNTIYNMFSGVPNLEVLILPDMDTSDVDSVSYMFDGLKNITSLDVSGYDFTNVSNIRNIFSKCPSLEYIDMSSLCHDDFTGYYSMAEVFKDSKAIKVVKMDAPEFSPSVIKELCNQISALSSEVKYVYVDNLTQIDKLSYDNIEFVVRNNYKTALTVTLGKPTRVRACTMPSSLVVEREAIEETRTHADLSLAFKSYSGLRLNGVEITEKDIKADTVGTLLVLDAVARDEYNWSERITIAEAFNIAKDGTTDYTNILTSISGDLDTSSCTSMDGVFAGANNMITADLSKFDTINVKSMSRMFSLCTALRTVNLTGLYTNRVTDFSLFFEYCESLTNVDVKHFMLSDAVNISGFFSGCKSISNLDISSWNAGRNTQNMSRLFADMTSVSNIDARNLYITTYDFADQANAHYMFAGCPNLKSINLRQWSANSSIPSENIYTSWFDGTLNLSDLDLSAGATNPSYCKPIVAMISHDNSSVVNVYIGVASMTSDNPKVNIVVGSK